MVGQAVISLLNPSAQEWASVLLKGSGVLVVRGTFPDPAPVDACSSTFRAIIADERDRGAGDHFSAGHDLGTPEQIQDVRERGTPRVGIAVQSIFSCFAMKFTKALDMPPMSATFTPGFALE